MRVPVGLVDNDGTSISRRFYRELNATAGIEVQYFANYTEAREAMQQGEIFGFLEVPKDFYADLLSYKQPNVGVYLNQTYMIPGTLAYKNFLSMANLASGAVQREVLRAKGYTDNTIMGVIQPIVIDMHCIGNPWSHYGVYLSNVILPGILQLCVLLMTIFSIGYELKSRQSREWLRCGGKSMVNSLIGKMLPYTIIFIIMGLALNVVLYKIMNFPLQGSIWAMFSATILMVLAAQAVGVTVIGLLPVLRDGISFCAIYGMLSISLAGMTFPLESMPSPIYGIGQAFPLRHYYLIYVHEGMLNGGFASCWVHYVAFFIFMLIPVLVLKRLNRACVYGNYPLK